MLIETALSMNWNHMIQHDKRRRVCKEIMGIMAHVAIKEIVIVVGDVTEGGEFNIIAGMAFVLELTGVRFCSVITILDPGINVAEFAVFGIIEIKTVMDIFGVKNKIRPLAVFAIHQKSLRAGNIEKKTSVTFFCLLIYRVAPKIKLFHPSYIFFLGQLFIKHAVLLVS